MSDKSQRMGRRAVEAAVFGQWDAFAGDHPRLAAILDQELLVEHAENRLLDDPAYEEAMAHAAAVGRVTTELGGIVERFVRRFFAEIVK